MRTIIVDDERQIREGLRILLSQIETINVVGEASTMMEAKEVIERLQPDLVLLDIQLKNKTGFDMLDALSNLNFKVIFVTAYNEYAIKAFKYNAFDYLLKPIDPEELRETITRFLQQNNATKQQLALLNDNSDFQKIIIKTSEHIYVLPIKEILHCKADQGYTHFYMNDSTHVLSSKTLKEYNALLPENEFVRVHQSHLVNWQYVISYDKKGFLILKNEVQIPVSVRKRHFVMELLKNKNPYI